MSHAAPTPLTGRTAQGEPMIESPSERLIGDRLKVGYKDTSLVLDDVTVSVPEGSFTVILGPNACGKSTILRTLGRLLKPRAGVVTLDGRDIARMKTRELAKSLALLPQSPSVPEGISVQNLVARGRFPHQSLMSQWSPEDEGAITEAMRVTAVDHLAHRPVDTLSGGQRQRVWISLVLAQETDLLLLDEPTTYLDVTHQVEILKLLERLRASGRTVVAVLHELNQAARFATDMVTMKDGKVVAVGSPEEIITEENMRAIYGLESRVIEDPDTGKPVVLPR
jgi:ABC-type cobalamin/Fe3+-siderophores transport system ATPase subunit